jgi:hypothetical protein
VTQVHSADDSGKTYFGAKKWSTLTRKYAVCQHLRCTFGMSADSRILPGRQPNGSRIWLRAEALLYMHGININY